MFNNYNYVSNDDFLGTNAEVPEFDYNSFYRAIVESIDDPEKLGRVKVRVPSLHQDIDVELLPFAYPAIFSGMGNQVGQFILPPVGSVVFITFEYSEERRPIYFGGLPTTYAEGKEQYYGKRINKGESKLVTEDDLPSEYNGSQFIIFKSPSGSIIYIDDTDYGPEIVLKDSVGQEIRFVSNDIREENVEAAILIKHDDDNMIRVGKGEVIIRVAGVDYAMPSGGGGGGTSDFNLLINKPTLNTNNSTSLPTSSNETIQGKLDLHKISKTGKYSDLQDLPTIPAEQVNSDWDSTTGKSQILNKPILSAVATSGEYSDLNNKPSIPTKTSDLTNNSGFITANSLPTKTSDLENDNQFITINEVPEQQKADWETTDINDYSYIRNKPSIPSIEGLESTSNKVEISSQATQEQYPNAKSVYDFVQDSISSIPQGLKIPVSLEKESDLPITGEPGDYYFIQIMDITGQGHTGKAWWNNDQWYKVFDQYNSMDGVSIVQTGGGAWQVSTEWLQGVLNLAIVARTGSYNDLSDKPTFKTVNDQTITGNGNIEISGVEELETATGEDINTGTDNEKYVTPKSIKDSKLLESSDGSVKDWITVDKTTFDDLVLNEQLEEGRVYNVIGDALQATTSTPVGATSIWFGLPNKIPVNYMLCEGQVLNKSDYVSLYDKIGDTYGSTSTTFNLPNLKGRIVVGYNNADTEFNTLGKTGGAKTHTLTVAQIPNHKHFMYDSPGGGTSFPAWAGITNGTTGAEDSMAYAGNTSYAGGGQAHNNIQPYITGYYIIKVREEAYTEDLRNLDREVNNMRGKLLWENPAPTEGISSGTITLSSDDYDYLEIMWKRTTVQNFIYITKFLKGSGIDLFQTSTSSGEDFYVRNRAIQRVSDMSFKYSMAYLQFTGQNRIEEPDGCIPLKIIGYKNNYS